MKVRVTAPVTAPPLARPRASPLPESAADGRGDSSAPVRSEISCWRDHDDYSCVIIMILRMSEMTCLRRERSAPKPAPRREPRVDPIADAILAVALAVDLAWARAATAIQAAARRPAALPSAAARRIAARRIAASPHRRLIAAHGHSFSSAWRALVPHRRKAAL